MGDYIGDKRKKSSSGSSGGDTKQFTAVKGNSSSKSSQSRSSASSGGGKSSSQKSSSRSGQQKGANAKNTAAKSGGAKKSSGSKSSSVGKTSGNSKNASGAKKNTSNGSSSAKSNTVKNPSQSSAKIAASSPKGSQAGKTSYSAKGASSAKTQSSSAKRPSSKNSQSQSGKSKSAYSEPLEKKRNSSYERELHSSQRAAEIKKARKRKTYNRYRKLFNFMFYAAIFIAVTAVIVIMSVTVLFGIESIVVSASDDVPYTSAQIISGCDVREGQNLFTAPIDGANEQIMTNLPYIETCTVERRLPSTVVITVTGAEAVGIVIDENGRRVIVSTGMRVLEEVVSDGDAPIVPVIDGVVVSATSVGSVVQSENISYIEAAVEIVRIMNEQGLKLDSISFSSGGNITAVYDGRINLVLGTATDLENKLLLAAMLINDGKITKHEAGDLNLSIDGKAIFTPDYVKQQYDREND